MARHDSFWFENSSTIAEVLVARAARHGDDAAYSVGEAGDHHHLSYGGLDDRARRIAGALSAVGATDSPVLLHSDSSLDFVCALFGCLYAQAIAVPLYPLDSARREQTCVRMINIVRDSGATVGLASSGLLKKLEVLAEEHEALRSVQWLDLFGAMQGPAENQWKERRRNLSDPAILQYTSGSTRRPRGVILVHNNILSNLKMMQRKQGYSRTHTFVSWLPLAHDWGLIGSVLLPMWCGSRAVFMTPGSFVARPVDWLKTISRHSNVTSGGPSFAYDYCVRRISPEERGKLDLSSWCRAGVGAGRVSADVLERFVKAFGPVGFRREVFYNGYGLAEATLSVSATSPLVAPTVVGVSRGALESDDVRVVDSEEEHASMRLVGSGEPNQGIAISIVDPNTGLRCPGGRVGEIHVSGPNVTSGYWNNAAETRAVFAVKGDASYLRTGDLGFIHDGQLFVTGRLKDMMVVRGRNVYPEDVEWAVEGCHNALRRGGVAAFELTGKLVVVQEMHKGLGVKAAEDIVGAIRHAVAEATGILVGIVVVVSSHEVPKTSSGKVRRSACREAYVDGELDIVVESDVDDDERDGRQYECVVTTAEVEVLRMWRAILGTDAVGVGDNFLELGGDSLRAYECQARLAEAFGVEIPLEWFMSDGATVRELARRLEGRVGK